MRIVLFGIFLVISMIFLPLPVFAHKLIQTDGTNDQIERSLTIPDPIVSWAMYEKLDGGVLYYTFDAKKNDRLYASIVIPKLDGIEYFAPSLVLMVPSFSIKFIDTIYDLDKTNLVPFAVPDGYDAFVFEYDDVLPSKEFYEPFGQITYWERQEIDLTIPVDSTYYLAVFDSESQHGKLALAVGYVEDFSASDFVTVLPASWFESRFFVEDYATPVLVSIILLLIVTTIGVFTYKKFKKKLTS